MKNLEFFGYFALAVALCALAGFGIFRAIEWAGSPENNPGYCLKVEYKTVFVPHPGWNASDLTYEEKQVPHCIEWENYKP